MKYILIILFEEMFYFLLSCLMAGRQSIVLLDLCTIRGSLLSSDPSCILKSSFQSRQKEGLNTFHYSRSLDSHSKDSCHQEGILLPIIFCSLYLVFSLLCDNSTEWVITAFHTIIGIVSSTNYFTRHLPSCPASQQTNKTKIKMTKWHKINILFYTEIIASRQRNI